MRTSSFTRTLSAWLVLAAALPAADKTALTPQWQSGKLYTMENVMEMNTVIPGLGEKGTQNTLVTQTMTIDVKDEAGTGNHLATVKFAAIKANMNMMGQTMTYDSTDPAKSQPMLQQAFGAIVGKEFTLVYDKNDKIIDARGVEDLVPTPVGGGKSPGGKQMVEAFRKGQEMGLPKDPVAPGDTWTFDDSIEMQPMGTIKIKGTGKFDSIVDHEGRKHAKILIEGTFGSSEGTANGAVKFLEGSKMSGETLFDIENHRASQSTVKNDLKMSAAGQEIPFSQKIVNRIVSVTDAK